MGEYCRKERDEKFGPWGGGLAQVGTLELKWTSDLH